MGMLRRPLFAVNRLAAGSYSNVKGTVQRELNIWRRLSTNFLLPRTPKADQMTLQSYFQGYTER